MKKTYPLILIWIAGLATIIASSSTEDAPDTPPTPVIVDFTLATLDTPLGRELATRTASLDNLLVAGEYDSTQGSTLTLDRTSVSLTTTSRFTLTVAPKTADELLMGTADFAVGAAIDVGLNHDPAAGQFSTVFDGTTTIVTVTANGVDTVVGGSTTTNAFSWPDFVALEDDNDAGLDLRMASAAYNMVAVLLRATILIEDIIADVESNRDTLEGMNLNSSLALTCDNGANEGTGESVLFWTTDASGSGEGSIGQNDAFEARYDNCRDAARELFRDGSVLLDNYNPADSAGFSIFGIEGDLRDVFLADSQIDLTTSPDDTSPRYNGTLSLFYVELATGT